MKYVALLRGVNVGGITVKSAPLKALFVELGFREVRTILASGNVVFADDGGEDHAMLKARIEAALGERFGYDARIVLIPHAAFADLAAAYPFPRAVEGRHAYVVFSSADDVLDRLEGEPVGSDAHDERIARGDGVLYWDVQKGSSLETPFAKALARKTYKPWVTTRNLNTVEKIAAM